MVGQLRGTPCLYYEDGELHYAYYTHGRPDDLQWEPFTAIEWSGRAEALKLVAPYGVAYYEVHVRGVTDTDCWIRYRRVEGRVEAEPEEPTPPGPGLRRVFPDAAVLKSCCNSI